MPLVAASDHESSARPKVIFAFVSQGVVGLMTVLVFTVVRRDETAAILRSLGGAAVPLIVVFAVFSLTLALLKFSLTEKVFVSFVLTAYTIMVPVLGLVVSAWVGVLAAALARVLGLLQLAPVKSDLEDPFVGYVKVFGQFGTYGIPLVVAALTYELLGGSPPGIAISAVSAARIALAGLVLQVMNNVVMAQVEFAYGYSPSKSVKLSLIDTAVFGLTLPFAVLVALSFETLGWVGILGWSFVGIMGNVVGRKLALAESASRSLIRRLTSLADVGRTIALDVPTSELLKAVYEACRPAVDVSFFTIVLVDPAEKELLFELDVRNGEVLPPGRMPFGEGLTSWVVQNHKPLLLRSAAEERKLGVMSVADGEQTESWLGVPMIARDRVVGAITLQSYKKDCFTWDDVVLLTAIANQAAVALANARLFKELEGLTQALEQRVSERTAELQETNVRLIAADRSKSQFLANMSHELRTPLNSIIGFSAVLMASARTSLEPRLYRFIENINAAGNYLLSLINDILDLSKIEAGRLRMHYETFDLPETILSVERVMKGTAAEHHISIVTSIDGDIPSVHLDQGRLKQILFNLMSNAVKFSHSRSVVHLTARRCLGSESPLDRDCVRITVADQGIGIAAEELPRIFDPFHQAEDGRRFRKQGTGLGLALTRSFVELMGGKVDVESALGAGSTFTTYLPIRPSEGFVNPDDGAPGEALEAHSTVSS